MLGTSNRHRSQLILLLLLTVASCLTVTLATAADVEDLLRECRDAYAAGDTGKAVELADKAVAAEPENVRCYLVRASVRDAMREFAKAIEDYDTGVRLDPKNADAYQRRGSAHFRAGHIDESIRDFDRFIEMEPEQEPHHWQRGIAYYYAGRFEDGRRQFESHQKVNTNDVENAAWHYLCVARVEGVEKARAALIPISGDARIPMAEVHALFAGKGTPQAVLAAARAGEPPPARLADQMFYAHLYLGLFHEAAGEAAEARDHIELAAGKYAQDHYMGDVARVHAARLRDAERKREKAAGKE